MFKFMQRNRKKMLAIFSVGLMVAFLIPTFGGRMDDEHANVAWGKTASGTTISTADIAHARDQWRLLQQVTIGTPPNDQPITVVLNVGQYAIMQRPELFYLLALEAEQSGIGVAPDVLEFWMERVRVKDPDGGRRPGPQSQQAHAVRDALRRLLMVEYSFEQARGVIKTSIPARQLMLAQLGQQLDINCVEYSADEFASQAPAPTDADLKSHFFNHGFDPETPGSVAANPMGFGYRLPDQVKFQYIEIPRAAVRDRIAHQPPNPADPAQTWDEKAYMLYFRNRADYRYRYGDDPLGESPFTLGQLPLALVDPARPSTRPFADVLPGIKDKLMDKPMDELQRKIEQAIQTLLDKDYARYAADGTTRPTSSPSLLGDAPYTSVEYLRAIAVRIEKEFGVRPKIAAYDNLMGASDITKLDDIGAAHPPVQQSLNAEPPTFGKWLVASAEGITKADKDALKINKPTAWLSDPAGNSFVARITESRVSMLPPRGVDDPDVRQKVTADWKLARGEDLAKKAAESLIAQADALGSLQSAANAALASRPASGPATSPTGRPMLTLTGISRESEAPLARLNLSPLSAQTLTNDLYEKLLAAAATQRHPRLVVDLPRDRKVLAIELERITPRWSDDFDRVSREIEAADGVAMSIVPMFMYSWYSIDKKAGVYARLGIKLDAAGQSSTDD